MGVSGAPAFVFWVKFRSPGHREAAGIFARVRRDMGSNIPADPDCGTG